MMNYWRRLSLVVPMIFLSYFFMYLLFVGPYIVSLYNSGNIFLGNIEQALFNIPLPACFILACVAAFKGKDLSQEKKNRKLDS